MIDTVFISDIHLHPDDLLIQARFNAFIEWARRSVKELYILGDLFHVWVGDDDINEWSAGIADQIKQLVSQGIPVYYMHGNRDFLLGKRYASLAGWTELPQRHLIELGKEKILLAHGDQYCTKDIKHQRFRKITRNSVFKTLFLSFPLKYRKKLINEVRDRSIHDTSKTIEEMDVVAETIIHEMLQFNIQTMIHGHTHKPGLTTYPVNDLELKRYVLSDWDDTPQVLCYNNTKGLYYNQVRI